MSSTFNKNKNICPINNNNNRKYKIYKFKPRPYMSGSLLLIILLFIILLVCCLIFGNLFSNK
jgi:hypothetical protein